jgi:lipopolysaccharide/colanic/teichoic acid biosynthesis glycosyltransferase
MIDVQARVLSRRASCFVGVDQILATLILVPLMPFAMLIAAAILVDSGFPVFFTQERLGLRGQRFRILKFRKFPASVGRSTRPLTLAEDSRFTRVGKFLADTKLDELPQIWNVVRGDMAMVGPRPEVPDFEACFDGEFQRVLEFRPGIFGPSQAAFRSEGTLYPSDQDPQHYYRTVLFPAKASLDLTYYPSRTRMGDLKWIFHCILAVCRSSHEMPVVLRHAGASAPAQAAASDTPAA